MTSKFRFLIVCEVMLLGFLAYEQLTTPEMVEAFKEPPANEGIVFARFLCAIFLHISLTDETKQGFNMMKYAMNHPWKFTNWGKSFRIGLYQMVIVVSVEITNMIILTTNNTIMDILMNFLALVIIADFDDYFFFTVKQENLAKLIVDGEV